MLATSMLHTGPWVQSLRWTHEEIPERVLYVRLLGLEAIGAGSALVQKSHTHLTGVVAGRLVGGHRGLRASA